jgi:hypothetical protein
MIKAEDMLIIKKDNEPDMRYIRCVLDGYLECAAKAPIACWCNQMPRQVYLDALKAKYGE